MVLLSIPIAAGITLRRFDSRTLSARSHHPRSKRRSDKDNATGWQWIFNNGTCWKWRQDSKEPRRVPCSIRRPRSTTLLAWGGGSSRVSLVWAESWSVGNGPSYPSPKGCLVSRSSSTGRTFLVEAFTPIMGCFRVSGPAYVSLPIDHLLPRNRREPLAHGVATYWRPVVLPALPMLSSHSSYKAKTCV